MNTELFAFLVILCLLCSVIVAAGSDEDAMKPWMRVLIILMGVSCIFWLPWLMLLAKNNYEMCFPPTPEPVPTSIEKEKT